MGIIGNLSSDQLDFFHTQGFLVLESFASDDEIGCLRKRIDELLDGFDGSSSVIFSTKNHVNIFTYQSSLE
ncbi:Phytanoyl-CoA dioxygenase-like protein [Drosera capensis]